MFRRDDDTGEEIAHLVTTPHGYTIVSAFPHMYEDSPGYTVDEVRGHSTEKGFIVDRHVDRPAPTATSSRRDSAGLPGGMTLRKPNPIEVIGAIVTAIAAGAVAANLADHGVSVAIVVSVVLSMLSAGLTLADEVAKAAATEVIRCSTGGCPFEFRVRRSHPPERRDVLREWAADHARHGSAGA